VGGVEVRKSGYWEASCWGSRRYKCSSPRGDRGTFDFQVCRKEEKGVIKAQTARERTPELSEEALRLGALISGEVGGFLHKSSGLSAVGICGFEVLFSKSRMGGGQ